VTLSFLGMAGMLLGFVLTGRPGLWAWALALPLGFAGLGTSLSELSRLDRRTASSSALRVARVGRALGFLHALLASAVLGLFALFLWSWKGGG
jgi:hypothetical protein